MCVGFLRMTFHLTGRINEKSLWLQHAPVVKLSLECESGRLFGHIWPLDLVKQGPKFLWNLWPPRLADIKTLFDFGGNLSQVSHLLGTECSCWRIFCWLCTPVTRKKKKILHTPRSVSSTGHVKKDPQGSWGSFPAREVWLVGFDLQTYGSV